MRRTGILCLVLMIVAVVVARIHDKGLLDGLNASIAACTEFQPFYAGLDNLPACSDLYPELKCLDDNFDALRDEVNLLSPLAQRVPTMKSTYNNMFLNATTTETGTLFKRLAKHGWSLLYGRHLQIFNKISSPDWRTLNLIVYGHIVLENVDLCPLLCSYLADMKCVQTALLSFMLPGAVVPPHTDPATGVLRYHMAFKVPKMSEKCSMVVGDQKYTWEEGKSVIFDTVFPHSVSNETDEIRIVLFLDLYRPLKGIAALLQGIANTANRYGPGTKAVIRESGLT